MKTPDECANMADIRAEIDHIDREVIALIGKRSSICASGGTIQNERGEREGS